MGAKRISQCVVGGLLISGCIMRSPPAPCSPGDDCSAANTAADDGAAVDTLPRTQLLPDSGVAAFAVQGETEKVALTPITAEGQPFKDAVRAEIRAPSNSEWSVQIQAPIVAPVAKGDVMLATFHVRAVALQESGFAETQFVFERAGEPYTKSVSYSLGISPEWRKVQVRFVSAEDYAPGQAQAIFRMGYDPQTIEIGGVTVESFGKQVALARLPTTQGLDRKYEPKTVVAPLLDPKPGGKLAFSIDPSKVRGKISPYVYGVNSQDYEGVGATVRRMGGNRQTVYNWENNASNAGHDWNHQSDGWPCEVLRYKTCSEPGGQFLSFVEENRKARMDSVVTIPILDYVAADKSGPVPEDQAPPSDRFCRSYPRKNGPRSLKPDLTDKTVYQDEFVNLLVQKLGRAEKGGARFYSLDNEPALWPSTHPRVHPDRTTYAEVIQRTEATASVITEIDPSAVVLGGIMFGWSEYMTLSSAPDAEQNNATYGTYVDYFLAQAQKLEAKHGRRLVHVLDVHWYPEAKGTKRITEPDASRKTIDARLAAPRSLWDPSYREKSWITDQTKEPIRLFPWLLEKIQKHYPGTKLSLTEYNFGAGEHISGGLAQADVLGILGHEGVYLANYWGNGAGVGKLPPLIASAFKLYRNYDGKGGTFGDTAVEASVTKIEQASVYAAIDSKRGGLLTVVVINKDQQAIFDGQLTLAGDMAYKSVKAWGFDARKPEVGPRPAPKLAKNVLSYSLPPLSATIFVLSPR